MTVDDFNEATGACLAQAANWRLWTALTTVLALQVLAVEWDVGRTSSKRPV